MDYDVWLLNNGYENQLTPLGWSRLRRRGEVKGKSKGVATHEKEFQYVYTVEYLEISDMVVFLYILKLLNSLVVWFRKQEYSIILNIIELACPFQQWWTTFAIWNMLKQFQYIAIYSLPDISIFQYFKILRTNFEI